MFCIVKMYQTTAMNWNMERRREACFLSLYIATLNNKIRLSGPLQWLTTVNQRLYTEKSTTTLFISWTKEVSLTLNISIADHLILTVKKLNFWILHWTQCRHLRNTWLSWTLGSKPEAMPLNQLQAAPGGRKNRHRQPLFTTNPPSFPHTNQQSFFIKRA